MSQTYVYAIHCPNKAEVKIGYSSNPIARLSQLQTGNTDRLDLLMTFPGGRELEQTIHEELQHLRVTGEWFNIDWTVLPTLEKHANAVLSPRFKLGETAEDITYIKRITDTLGTKKYSLSEINKLVPDISKKQLKATLLLLGWTIATYPSSRNVYYIKPKP